MSRKGKPTLKIPPSVCGDYIFFIQYESVSVVRGAVIDYLQTGLTQAWVIDNPNSAWDSEPAREIAKTFDELINPGVAEHGGHIKLAGLKDHIAYVEMSGGCQGLGISNIRFLCLLKSHKIKGLLKVYFLYYPFSRAVQKTPEWVFRKPNNETSNRLLRDHKLE